MPATQSSLDGFFGVKKSTVKKQTTLSGFITKAKQDKENVLQDSDEENVLEDSDEDEKIPATKVPAKRESPVSSETSVKSKRRRAIVDDEDEDDEDEVTPMEVVKEENDDTKEEKKQAAMDTLNETLKTTDSVTKPKENLMSAPSPTVTPPRTEKEEVKKVKEEVKKVKEEVNEDAVNEEDVQEEQVKDEENTAVKKEQVKDEEKTAVKKEQVKDEETTIAEKAPTTPHEKLVQDADRLAKAMKFRSNKELLKTAGTTHAPIPYATLVGVFEQIDKITSRLEIQGLLTSLFRQVLLTTPQDLYPVVYLASNSVAPAFECVELGIGDSILIKAIGEAYGTNPCKYHGMI
jgi:hypothetical protein